MVLHNIHQNQTRKTLIVEEAFTWKEYDVVYWYIYTIYICVLLKITVVWPCITWHIYQQHLEGKRLLVVTSILDLRLVMRAE